MKTAEGFQKSLQDIHTRTMKKNYPTVPNSWFLGILVLVFGLSLLVCEGFGRQIQLPWWGLILACALAFLCTLPIGIIQALTSQVQQRFYDLSLSSYIYIYIYMTMLYNLCS